LFPHRQLCDDEVDSVANGRALNPAGIDGVYAAHTADRHVIALLRDEGSKTKSVVVIRPANL
jgi:tRNA pseudouridine55 synthase